MTTRHKTPRRLEVWMRVRDHDRLKRARLRSPFRTQVELARALKCTQQYVSALENGDKTTCSDDIAIRICRLLNIDLEAYFEAKELAPMPPVTTRSRVESRQL